MLITMIVQGIVKGYQVTLAFQKYVHKGTNVGKNYFATLHFVVRGITIGSVADFHLKNSVDTFFICPFRIVL